MQSVWDSTCSADVRGSRRWCRDLARCPLRHQRDLQVRRSHPLTGCFADGGGQTVSRRRGGIELARRSARCQVLCIFLGYMVIHRDTPPPLWPAPCHSIFGWAYGGDMNESGHPGLRVVFEPEIECGVGGRTGPGTGELPRNRGVARIIYESSCCGLQTARYSLLAFRRYLVHLIRPRVEALGITCWGVK